MERNELCHCGSGKKSKKCCGAGASSKSAAGLALVIVPLALVAGLGIFSVMKSDDAEATAGRAAATLPAAPAATPGPQPAGQAPAGKVWSAEHGHWHDADAKASPAPIQIEMSQNPGGVSPMTGASGRNIQVDARGILPPQQPAANVPQPPGPAPEGKVWSSEHGHWHDEGTEEVPTTNFPVRMGTVNFPSQPVAQDGVAPPGKIWSAEHGHWHDDPNAKLTGPVRQPEDPFPAPVAGPATKRVWSVEHGHWHNEPPSGQPKQQ